MTVCVPPAATVKDAGEAANSADVPVQSATDETTRSALPVFETTVVCWPWLPTSIVPKESYVGATAITGSSTTGAWPLPLTLTLIVSPAPAPATQPLSDPAALWA